MYTSDTRAPSLSRIAMLGTAILIAGGVPAPDLTAAPPSADYIGRIGFRDYKHTRNDGHQDSVVLAINPAGYVAGESLRFFGVPHPEFGALDDQSAWIASPLGGTKSAGLYGAAHTSATGYHYSSILQMSASGKVIGHSTRFRGEPIARGQSAWIADWNGGTRRIGLYYDDPTPPLPDGTVHNTVLDLNERGQTIGFAPVHRGQSAWLAENDGTTRMIGFYTAAYTTPGAAPDNTPVALNESGTAIGNTRFNTNWQVAWLQPKNGSPAVKIGLYGPDYTFADGRQYNEATALNDRGQIIGRALRKTPYGTPPDESYLHSGWLRNPDGSMVVFQNAPIYDTSLFTITNSGLIAGNHFAFGGDQAWVYDIAAGTTNVVGLDYDSEVSTFHNFIALTENGVAIGSTTSRGFGGTTHWLAPRNGPTYRIGFTSSATDHGSTVTDYSSNGYVVGTTIAPISGNLAWIASPVTGQSYRIGLLDATHTKSGGGSYRISVPTEVTRSRFVAGYSERYSGENSAGQTAWVYNSPAGSYARFDISVRASDNYSYSVVHHVTENGIAVGTYRLFDAEGNDLGDRAFVWVTKRGVVDLGSALNVDLATVNWESLAEAVAANPGGFIAGHGVPSGSDARGAFLVRLDDPPQP